MQIVVKTLFGLEEVLAEELKSLGCTSPVIMNRAVKVEGDMEMLYRINYRCRTAMSVLMPIASFQIGSDRDLYHRAAKIAWDDYFTHTDTFSVVPVVNSTLFNHTGYPALVLKDSIVDLFRKRVDERPSVDTARPDIVINLHISDKRVNISLDSSGDPLHRRGYRVSPGKAPINEVLAAGMIMISGWNGETTLLDPMCGSGTIGLEAAMINMEIPPGKFRQSWSFMNWKGFDSSLLERVRSEADSRIKYHCAGIVCSDISRDAITTATMNLSSAGLASHVKLVTKDFFASSGGGKKYTIITNPPYGERIREEDISGFYSSIGERLKHGYESSTAWIITSNLGALKHVGLKPSKKLTLFNGSLECRYVRYELFPGRRNAGKG
ncbi:MAG: class I SAM-dependent RNA methyltransferase [Bacteroidales bacterium]